MSGDVGVGESSRVEMVTVTDSDVERRDTSVSDPRSATVKDDEIDLNMVDRTTPRLVGDIGQPCQRKKFEEAIPDIPAKDHLAARGIIAPKPSTSSETPGSSGIITPSAPKTPILQPSRCLFDAYNTLV